jgi:hypothetical protein
MMNLMGGGRGGGGGGGDAAQNIDARVKSSTRKVKADLPHDEAIDKLTKKMLRWSRAVAAMSQDRFVSVLGVLTLVACDGLVRYFGWDEVTADLIVRVAVIARHMRDDLLPQDEKVHYRMWKLSTPMRARILVTNILSKRMRTSKGAAKVGARWEDRATWSNSIIQRWLIEFESKVDRAYFEEFQENVHIQKTYDYILLERETKTKSRKDRGGSYTKAEFEETLLAVRGSDDAELANLSPTAFRDLTTRQDEQDKLNLVMRRRAPLTDGKATGDFVVSPEHLRLMTQIARLDRAIHPGPLPHKSPLTSPPIGSYRTWWMDAFWRAEILTEALFTEFPKRNWKVPVADTKIKLWIRNYKDHVVRTQRMMPRASRAESIEEFKKVNERKKEDKRREKKKKEEKKKKKEEEKEEEKSKKAIPSSDVDRFEAWKTTINALPSHTFKQLLACVDEHARRGIVRDRGLNEIMADGIITIARVERAAQPLGDQKTNPSFRIWATTAPLRALALVKAMTLSIKAMTLSKMISSELLTDSKELHSCMVNASLQTRYPRLSGCKTATLVGLQTKYKAATNQWITEHGQGEEKVIQHQLYDTLLMGKNGQPPPITVTDCKELLRDPIEDTLAAVSETDFSESIRNLDEGTRKLAADDVDDPFDGQVDENEKHGNMKVKTIFQITRVDIELHPGAVPHDSDLVGPYRKWRAGAFKRAHHLWYFIVENYPNFDFNVPPTDAKVTEWIKTHKEDILEMSHYVERMREKGDDRQWMMPSLRIVKKYLKLKFKTKKKMKSKETKKTKKTKTNKTKERGVAKLFMMRFFLFAWVVGFCGSLYDWDSSFMTRSFHFAMMPLVVGACGWLWMAIDHHVQWRWHGWHHLMMIIVSAASIYGCLYNWNDCCKAFQWMSALIRGRENERKVQGAKGQKQQQIQRKGKGPGKGSKEKGQKKGQRKGKGQGKGKSLDLGQVVGVNKKKGAREKGKPTAAEPAVAEAEEVKTSGNTFAASSALTVSASSASSSSISDGERLTAAAALVRDHQLITLADISSVDTRLPTLPLALAAHAGDLPRLAQLLVGADVDEVDNGTGRTALSFAVEAGHVACVDMLTAINADVNKPQGNDGASCVYTAAKAGRSRVLRHLLLVEGVDVERADTDNTTPLFAAAAGGHHNCVSALLRTGLANVNARDDYGWSPVLAACLACAKTLTLTDTTHTGVKKVKPYRCLVLLLASREVNPGTLVHATMALRALRKDLMVRDGRDDDDDDDDEGGKLNAAEGKYAGSSKRQGSARVDSMLRGMLFPLPILDAECTRERRWCAYPPCHDVDTTENMDLCTGCRTVGYCSRRCQKQHWKEKGQGWVRHKEVCVDRNRLLLKDEE